MRPKPTNIPNSPTLRKAWKELHQVAPKGILNSGQMTRRQRERLSNAGYLDPIMRGWYRLTSPQQQPGSPTDLLDFLPVYLEERLGNRWCLSAESSLVIRMNPQGNPGRLVVMAEIGSTTVHTFENALRLTIYQDDQQLPTRTENFHGFRLMPVDTILGRMTNTQWNRQQILVDQVLPKVTNWEPIIWQWLSEERFQSVIRLGLRLRELGYSSETNIIKKCLKEEGLTLPDTKPSPPLIQKTPSPTVDHQTINDLESAWSIWTKNLTSSHLPPPRLEKSLLKRLSSIEHSLADDVQNHLGLSGFIIPREAIMQVLAEPELAADAHGWPTLDDHERLTLEGHANPLPGETDPQALVSMQGYLEALKLVKRSIVRMMEGAHLKRILKQDVRGWRMALMSPSAEAGMITRRQVLRYREAEAGEPDLRTSMESWMEMVADCPNEFQRGLLAFLGIQFLKPWQYGNQRMAFLILNALNASEGLPWIILDQEERNQFAAATQTAISLGDTDPLVELLAKYNIQ